jgi:hypothetical protein
MLAVWAVLSSWNPTLFFLVGLLLFDAVRRGCRLGARSGN